MKNIVFGGKCAVEIDFSKENVAVETLLNEYKYHILDGDEVPVIGRVCVSDDVSLTDTAVLLHDKRLYADGRKLYCVDGNSSVLINLTDSQFYLEVDDKTNPSLLILVVQTLLNWYMPQYGLVFMHTASFKYNDSTYAISGFGGAGKTEVMLEMLQKGAIYISDDLAIFDIQGKIYPYLRKISLHDYPFSDSQLERFNLSRWQYRLMKYCQQKSGRVTQYIYRRLRGRFNISVDCAQWILPDSNSPLNIDRHFWLDSMGKTAFIDVDQNTFNKKMTFCMQNEFRSYCDFDGYFGCIFDFWERKKELYNKIIQSTLLNINIEGIAIKGEDYLSLSELIISK